MRRVGGRGSYGPERKQGYMRVLQDWFNRSLIFTRLLLLLYFLCRLRSCGVIFFFFLFCGSGFSFFFFLPGGWDFCFAVLFFLYN